MECPRHLLLHPPKSDGRYTQLTRVAFIIALESTELVSQPVTKNGTWTDKESSHFSTTKEISVKATFFFI